jgi:hypothetical protein
MAPCLWAAASASATSASPSGGPNPSARRRGLHRLVPRRRRREIALHSRCATDRAPTAHRRAALGPAREQIFREQDARPQSCASSFNVVATPPRVGSRNDHAGIIRADSLRGSSALGWRGPGERQWNLRGDTTEDDQQHTAQQHQQCVPALLQLVIVRTFRKSLLTGDAPFFLTAITLLLSS